MYWAGENNRHQSVNLLKQYASYYDMAIIPAQFGYFRHIKPFTFLSFSRISTYR